MIQVLTVLIASHIIFSYATGEDGSVAAARVKRQNVPYDFSKGFGGPWTSLYVRVAAGAHGQNYTKYSLLLGENCTADDQCWSAYSYCEPPRNVCACEPGFWATKDGLCDGFFIGSVSNCPSWNSNDTSSCYKTHKSCLVQRELEPRFRYKDDCAADEFCFLYNFHVKERELFVGHCCPLPPKNLSLSEFQPACPLGKLHPEDSSCLAHNHAPFDFRFVENGPKKSICCSVPCFDKYSAYAGSFVLENRCFDRKDVNETCYTEMQCPYRHVCAPQDGSSESTCWKNFTSSRP